MKLTGLIVMLVGIAVIVVSFLFKSVLDIIKIAPVYATIAGLILVAAGYFFMSPGTAKQSDKEVPIYEGEGRNRKIVGYKREK
jgi:hypothetical protein